MPQWAAELHRAGRLTQAVPLARALNRELAERGELGVGRFVVAGEEQHLAPIVVRGSAMMYSANMALNALMTVAPGRCRATHSLPVSSPRSTNPE